MLKVKLKMNKLFYLLFSAAGIIVIGSLVIYSVESEHPDSQINSMLDAVWWTVATVTTVGYGDVVPVTDTGKIVAIFLHVFLELVYWDFLFLYWEHLFTRNDLKKKKRIFHMLKN